MIVVMSKQTMIVHSSGSEYNKLVRKICGEVFVGLLEKLFTLPKRVISPVQCH